MEQVRYELQTHQFLAELNGAELVAGLLPGAAAAEDADPPEPGGTPPAAGRSLRLDFHVKNWLTTPIDSAKVVSRNIRDPESSQVAGKCSRVSSLFFPLCAASFLLALFASSSWREREREEC